MKTLLNSQIEKLCVSPQTSLRGVIQSIQKGNKQIALVVDEERRLLGTITDGDVRRAVLRGTPFEAPASEVMNRSFHAGLYGMTHVEVFELMRAKSLRHVPLVDDRGVLMDLVWISDLIREDDLNIPAVVMAGGLGTRLRPLTEEMPKPLLPLGDKPLLEIIIQRLRHAGVHRVNVATHYKGDQITSHFGDGRDFGVQIEYVHEDRPLGTAGALSLLDTPAEPLLVINGDILTRVDFRALLDFHKENKAHVTVAVRQTEFHVPYGVIETNGGVDITGISEKPVVQHFINAGIYLLDPEVFQYVPKDLPYDMPDLINRLVADGRRAVSFPVWEYWLDIGRLEDYQKAQAEFGHGRYVA